MFQSLYLHIPFCEKKCPYCDFNSHAGQDERIAPYLAALEREIASAPPAAGPLETVFVGGGTPTYVPAEGLARVLAAARDRFGFGPGCEVTVEANPGSADAEKFEILRAAGVNRVSIGVQSWDESMLRFLGRVHSAEEAERAFRSARKAGFENINLDLIHSLPGQTISGWRDGLRRTADLGSEHVSAYCLTYEPETAFGAALRRGEMAPLPDEAQRTFLGATEEELSSAGYEQYEISNFARPGRSCRHNQMYWSRRGYLGVGAGAHSFFPFSPGGRRAWNVRPPQAYVDAIASRGSAEAGCEELDSLQAMEETVMLSLRTGEGLDLEPFAQRFGAVVSAAARDFAEDPRWKPLVSLRDGRSLVTNAEGRMLADALIVELVRHLPAAQAAA